MNIKIPNLIVSQNITLKSALNKINKNGKKCLIISNKNQKLLGILTDGDVRHAINKDLNLDISIKQIYNNNPLSVIENEYSSSDILNLFHEQKVFVIPVINKNNLLKDVYFLDEVLSKKKISLPKIKIDVFIMAGGIGKRLRPLTEILPKPLFPVNGKPIIQKIIHDFDKYNIKNFFISINYKSKILKAYLSDLKQNKKINYIYEKIPLGTAGSLRKVSGKISNNFFLTNADIFIDIDFKKIYDFHIKNKSLITIVAIKKKIVIPYGNCVFDNENSLSKIDEKPSFQFYVNSGIYVCNRKIIKFIPKNKLFNMDDLINKVISNKSKVKVYKVDNSNWTDIGEWSQYNSILNKNL